MNASSRLDQDLLGGAAAQDHGAPTGDTQVQSIGRPVPGLDPDTRARRQSSLGYKAQKRGRLIGDPHDAKPPTDVGAGQPRIGPSIHTPPRRRYRIPVRVGARVVEEGVDPVEHTVGDGVLELLGILVYLGPVHAEHLHEKGLDQAVPPQRGQGEVQAVARQSNAGVWLVVDEAGSGEGLDHGGCRARRDADAVRQGAHRHLPSGLLLLQQVQPLDIILDRAACHVREILAYSKTWF